MPWKVVSFTACCVTRTRLLEKKIEDRTQALAQSERQLQQVMKLQAIGTLAGGIAHDFNNILFPILGYTELTMDDIPEDSQAKQNLERSPQSSQSGQRAGPADTHFQPSERSGTQAAARFNSSSKKP